MTDTWETKASMSTNRSQMQANVVNGKIYLTGGRTGGAYSTVNVTEVYDPETDSWTTKASIPYPVVSCQSAVIDGKIYIIGGQDEFASPMNLDKTQIYDTVSNTWSLGAPLPAILTQGAAAATTGIMAPRRIYVMGGEGGFVEPLNQNYAYDPQADVWSIGAPLPTARYGPAIAVVDDLIYLIGGGGGWGIGITAVERYTPFGYGLVPSIVSPENNKAYNMNSVPLSFSVSQPTAWTGYSLDGQDSVTVMGNVTLSGLSYGSHYVTVYANNSAGIACTSETIYFSISQPFPTTWAAAAAIFTVIVVVAGLVVFFRKRKR